MVNIKYGPTEVRHNTRHIDQYKSYTNVHYINPKNTCDDVNILSPVIYFFIILKLGHKVYNRAMHEDLDVNSYWSCT